MERIPRIPTPCTFAASILFALGSGLHAQLAVLNDTASTAFETPIQIDVLSNDTNVYSGILSLSIPPSMEGTIAVTSDLEVLFTPASGFIGPSQFSYTAVDSGPLQRISNPESSPNFDRFGDIVDIDGDFAVVGVPRDDSADVNAGAVYVYEKQPNGTWQFAQRLDAGIGADQQDELGFSVAISADPENDFYLIAAGAPGDDDNGSASGAVYLFGRGQNGIWTQTAKLKDDSAPLTGTNSDRFGEAVDVRGPRVVVGAPGTDRDSLLNVGSVYIFQDVGGFWAEIQEISGSAAGASPSDANANFGQAVALAGDAAIAIGAPLENADGVSNNGAVYIVQEAAGSWQIFQKVSRGSTAGGNDGYGTSLAITDNYLFVGAPMEDTDPQGFNDDGIVYIYERSGQLNLNFLTTLSRPFAEGGYFGDSISVDDEDLVLAVGVPRTDDDSVGSGGVDVYQFQNDTWVPLLNLHPNLGSQSSSDRFGQSVGYSDGNIIVGAPQDSEFGIDVGSIYFGEPMASTASALVTVTVDAPPFPTFEQYLQIFYSGQTAPDTVGSEGDPDKDGNKNLLEYALGKCDPANPALAVAMDPSVPDQIFQDFRIVNGDTLEFSVKMRDPALYPDLSVMVEVSRDLVSSGFSSAGVSVSSSTPAGNGFILRTFSVPAPNLSSQPLFARVTVTLN
ncbi:MAG: Ig-like domain-containing protein [Opitutaceae bacterium]